MNQIIKLDESKFQPGKVFKGGIIDYIWPLYYNGSWIMRVSWNKGTDKEYSNLFYWKNGKWT